MNLAQALAQASAAGVDRLDAQLLLLHVLGRDGTDRAWLLAHDDEELAGPSLEAFQVACKRRADNEPLAYIVGRKEFHGVGLQVDRRALVPRPDTETLVDWAVELLLDVASPRVIDLGTGSGAIALAIKKSVPHAVVSATDSSSDALELARLNAQHLGLGVSFGHGSWLDNMQGTSFDLIVSNPPYVAQGDPHLPALRHEPAQALVSGTDGLDAIREIVKQSPSRLEPGGWLLLEHGWDQAAAVRTLLTQAGFGRVTSRRDLAGIERCTGGQWLELG